jgi:hypothetical protein
MRNVFFRLSDEEFAELEAFCEAKGRTKSDVLRELIRGLGKRGVAVKRGPIRQGDVLLVPSDEKEVQGEKGEALNHLNLALGEVTGHSHRIDSGEAVLYKSKSESERFLKVLSFAATLRHEEHAALEIPKGVWKVLIQREYEPGGWKHVAD